MEKLEIIKTKSNKYDLTQILEIVCNYYDSPDQIRRLLMQCYMYIANNAITHDLSYIAEPLTALGLIIEALDNTTTTDTPPLIVSVKNN